jgi:hypothetical protein
MMTAAEMLELSSSLVEAPSVEKPSCPKQTWQMLPHHHTPRTMIPIRCAPPCLAAQRNTIATQIMNLLHRKRQVARCRTTSDVSVAAQY